MKNIAISKAPERYLLRVLRKLVNAVLNNVRSDRTSIRLAKTVNKTLLSEIVEAVDGPIGKSERIDLPVMPAKASAGMMNAFKVVKSDAPKQLARSR